MDLDARLHDAVARFWSGRKAQTQKQIESGRIDAGTRGAVTGGAHTGALELLVKEVLVDAGINAEDVRMSAGLELPGYFRPEKKWDLVVVSRGVLVASIEFKSMVGSVGNNTNNRAEEAIGNAKDIWVAVREGRFGTSPPPFLGYFFLLQDEPDVHRTRSAFKEPHFAVDGVFQSVTYARRFEIMCRRLILERLYTSACLILSTPSSDITQPADDLSFQRFIATLRGHAVAFLGSQPGKAD